MEVAAAEATMRLNASCATYRAAPIEPLLRLEFSAETPGPTDFAKIRTPFALRKNSSRRAKWS